jgi:predicted ATPase with chaperone activity
MRAAMSQLNLLGRAFHHILKLARTIRAFGGSAAIPAEIHVELAIYCLKDLEKGDLLVSSYADIFPH